MLGSFAAEWLKLRRRAATYIIGAIWLAVILLFEYLLPYLIFKDPPHSRSGAPAIHSAALIASLLPRNLLSYMVPGSSTLGGTLMLILAALVGGSEYSWSTLKTILTQRPNRMSIVAGKLIALALVLVLFVVLGFAAATLASLIVALADHAAITWPPLVDIIKSAAAMLLILSVWASLGLVLSVVFRGTGLAIGLGLVYAIVVENLLNSLASSSDAIKTIDSALPGANASALITPFRTSLGVRPADHALTTPIQAAIVLGIYVAAFALVTTILVQRRDVT